MRLVILFVLLVGASPALSRYQGVELEQVPVARLIENLEKISKENPNSAEAWLNLGRAIIDRRVPGVLERVHEAGREIIEACVAAGGVLSG